MNKAGYLERKAVYEAAVSKWGMEAQELMAIEEMAELTKEICKARRGGNNLMELVDEIADVTIMLEQLRLMFGLNELVCERMDQKIDRLKERLNRD